MLPNGKPNSICVKKSGGKVYCNRKKIILDMINIHGDGFRDLCDKYKNEFTNNQNKKYKRVSIGLLDNQTKKNEKYHDVENVFYNHQHQFDYPWA